MRVLWMLSGLAMGGSERNIVSVLPHLRDCGATVALCTLNARRDSPLAQVFSQTGIPRHDLAARRMLDPAAFRRFSQLLSQLHIDLIHAEDQDTIVYAGLAHRMLGIPTVMTRHVLEEPATTWKEALRAQLVLWAARFGMDRIIAVSEFVRRRFARQARVPLSRIETIYNGIDLDRFASGLARQTLRSNLGWDAELPIATCISVLRPGKGFEVLFQAVPEIRARIPDFQVKIIGSGPLEAELRQQAASVGDAVDFLGQRMDIPDLLRASDLLIQASWSEALPTVLIEAGAAALPVVATDVGGSTEIVQHEQGGLIIPPGDAAALAASTIALLQSPGRAAGMGRRAQDFVHKTFSLPVQAERTLALYSRLLGSPHEDPL